MTPRQKTKDKPLEGCIKTPTFSDVFGVFKNKEDKSCGTLDLQRTTDALKNAAVERIKNVFGK